MTLHLIIVDESHGHNPWRWWSGPSCYNIYWNTLFVPSAAIKDDTDNLDIFRYFSNQSSTFAPGPPGLVRHKYAGVTFEDELVNDIVQTATLTVDDQPFISAAYANASEIHYWMGYDDVLGLSPRWDTSGDDPEMPSPWSWMVQRGLLDHNLFAFNAPRTSGGGGELSLG